MPDTFEPSDHTVAEVLEYADANPDEVQKLLDDEKAGQNRATAISGLESRVVEDDEDTEVATREGEEEAPEEPLGVNGEFIQTIVELCLKHQVRLDLDVVETVNRKLP